MAIKGKLIIFDTYSLYKTKLSLGEIPPLAIVFIKDTGLIITHATNFGGNIKDKDSNSITISLAGVSKDVALANHNHSNYVTKDTTQTITAAKTFQDISILNDSLTPTLKFNRPGLIGWQIKTGGSGDAHFYIGTVDSSGKNFTEKLKLIHNGTTLSGPTEFSGNAKTATSLKASKAIKLTGDVSGSASFNGSNDASITTTINQVAANKISGIIDIKNLPQGALERLIVVKDDKARFALDVSKALTGDTVKVESTGNMYFIIDDSKLSTEAGYSAYTAGAATSVPWSGITDKPETFTPAEHNHDTQYNTKKEITDFLEEKANKNLNVYIGTTLMALNRASGAQTLQGVNITGNAATATNIEWSGINNPPETYKPSEHNHDDAYYTKNHIDTNFFTQTKITELLNKKAANDLQMFIGTTAVKINRTSGALTLAGISLDNASVSKTGETLTVKINGTTESLTNTKYSNATDNSAGLMSSADKKLLGELKVKTASVTLTLKEGTEIGQITINGNATSLFCEKNTWRGITDDYTGGASADIGLSQKGAKALYEALIDGHSSTADTADSAKQVLDYSNEKIPIKIGYSGEHTKSADELAAYSTTSTGTRCINKIKLSTVKTALGSMPASDVHAWAKASTKPSYTSNEVHSLDLDGGILDGLLEIRKTGSAASYKDSAGYFNSSYVNMILRGDAKYGRSGIVFTSSKGNTAINQPSDGAFILYAPYGGLASSTTATGETGCLVIGIDNDETDLLLLQTPHKNGLKAVTSNGDISTICHSGNSKVTKSGETITVTINDTEHSLSNTHYTAKNILATSGDSKTTATTANTNTFLNLIENNVVRSSQQITGTGIATVSSNGSKLIIDVPNTNVDTQNTTGSINSTNKIFLTGALSLATSAVTYSNSECFALSGYLYSKGKQVSTTNTGTTLVWDSAIKVATINGVDVTVKLPINPDTHKTSKNIIGDAATKNIETKTDLINGKVFLNHLENTTLVSSHKIIGNGTVAVTYDVSEKAIIIKGTDTNTDTKNTAGASNSENKLFLVGATSQTDGIKTYSNVNCYISEKYLYSNGKKVAATNTGNTLSWNTPITLGTINGVNITAKLPINPNTHYDAKNIIGNLATSKADIETTNDATFLNLIENGTVRSHHLIKGTGIVKVKHKNGVLEIDAPDTNVNYYLTGVSGTCGGNITFTRNGLSNIVWNSAHNHDTKYLKRDGTNTYDNATLKFSTSTMNIESTSGSWHLKISTADSSDKNVHRFTFNERLGDKTEYVELFGVDGNGDLYAKGRKVSLNGHTHSYLPLSGGILANANLGAQLDIYRKANAYSIIKFSNNNSAGTKLTVGYIGFNTSGNVIYRTAGGADNTIYHSGNLKFTPAVSSATHTDWNNHLDYLVTKGFLSYWNGAYNASKSSNLAYCVKGTFGSIVTKNTGDYLAISGGTLTGPLKIKGNAASQPLMARGIVGSDGNGNAGELYLQYGVDSVIHLGANGTHTISADGSKYSGDAATVNGLTVEKAVPKDAKFTDTIYTHPTSPGNKHIPEGGKIGQILKYKADGEAQWGNEFISDSEKEAWNKGLEDIAKIQEDIKVMDGGKA